MYLFLGVGFGAFCCSWMNDSGFWVVSRLGGLTERETLRSWTVLLTVTSIIGLIFTLLVSTILPLRLER
jgi:GntP family gluconate:H+ symporter